MAVPAGCGGGGGGQPTATHFSVGAQGNVIAGTTFNFTVTALEAACKPDDGDNQMKEKDEDIAHPGVVSVQRC